MIPYHLDWVCGVLAMTSTYVVGKKKWYGWPIAAITNACFVYLNIKLHVWGVVPVSATLCVMNVWNTVKWLKCEKQDA